jgi:hypothetical protein
MLLSRVLKVRYLAVLLLVLILAASAYAFAAVNDVDKSAAGDGAATISGYDVTNVHYTLDTSNPIQITKVEFDIANKDSSAKVPVTVKAKLIASGTWFTCSASSPWTHWSCPITSVTVADALNLAVAAAQ